MSKLKYLFISGCARSGTTALTRLLNGHPHIFLGTELFRKEFNDRSDSFGPKLVSSKKYQDKVLEKNSNPNNIRIIGDKFPSYYKDYEFIFSRFTETKVLFIFRNIFDVAQSYKARKIHPTNPWKKGVKRAVTEWNSSLENTLEFIKKGYDIQPLCYEKILFNPSNKLENILALNNDTAFRKGYKKIARDGSKIEEKKINILNSDDKHYIMKEAKFNLYKKILRIAEKPIRQIG